MPNLPPRKIDPAVFEKRGSVPFELVELGSKQKQEWEMTRTALLWNCPAFTHILYNMLTPPGARDVAVFTRDIPTAATDGIALYINPDYFFKYPLQKRIFITVHEIAHCMLNHCGVAYAMKLRGKVSFADGKSLDYDAAQMNIAQDLVINDMLVQSKVGELDPDWLHDPATATAADSTVDVYRKIFDPKKCAPWGPGPSPVTHKGKGSFDEHLPPGQGQAKDPVQTSQSRNEVEWHAQIEAAAAAAKAQGKLPKAMEAFFKNILNPVVPWGEKIQGWFARKVGSGNIDWKRPDRRLIVRDIYAPGRTGYGAGWIIVGFDTSGSIYADMEWCKRMVSELSGLLSEVRPKRLTVLWCDAAVHKVEDIDELTDIAGLRPVGGGGTSFIPVFDWIAEHEAEPDALVYLTDGDGSFPAAEPKYPVLWGDISHNGAKYPWGDVVDIPK